MDKASVSGAEDWGFESLQGCFFGSIPQDSVTGWSLGVNDGIVRSYHGESTRSHPNSEVKHHWACSVLRWGTTRESQVAYVFSLLGRHRFEPVGIALCCSYKCAIGLVVKYFVANEVPRVRFPDGAFLLSWRSWQRVGLIIPRSPVRSRSKAVPIPVSLGGQDTRLSPERPGFNSLRRNVLFGMVVECRV